MPVERDPFERLADDVEALWKRDGYDPASFARIAMRALRAHAALAERSELAERSKPVGRSGLAEDGGVLAVRERFAVRLDARPSSTVVHSHDHAGAFCVVRGASLHATYRFVPCGVANPPGLAYGDLAPTSLEELAPGDVRAVP